MPTWFSILVVAAWARTLAASEPCLPVRGDWITTADLARAAAVFSEAAGQPVTLAPLAGASRTITRPELRRYALRLGLDTAEAVDWPASVCFAHPLEPLDEQRIHVAVGKAFPGRRFELAEISRFPVPKGELVFATSTWRADRRDGTKLLSGHVQYGLSRRVAVWARVRPLSHARGLVAAEDLPAGTRLEARLVREADLAPGAEQAAQTWEELSGYAVRRRLAAGTPITRALLVRPPDVSRGDLVLVEAKAGQAVLSFQSRAETAGSAGEQVLLTNPQSGQRFRGRVVASGRVRVEVGAGGGS